MKSLNKNKASVYMLNNYLISNMDKFTATERSILYVIFLKNGTNKEYPVTKNYLLTTHPINLRQLNYIMKSLEQKGAIVKEVIKNQSHYWVNERAILCNEMHTDHAVDCTVEQEEVCNTLHSQVCNRVHTKVCNELHTSTNHTIISNKLNNKLNNKIPPIVPQQESPPVSPAKAEPVASEDVLLVFSHWQTRMNHPRAKLDDKLKKKIKEALKLGYSTTDLLDAIDGCAKTPHNMGQNDRLTVYDSLELILRNSQNITRFIKNNETIGMIKNEQPQKLTRSQESVSAYARMLAADRWV